MSWLFFGLTGFGCLAPLEDVEPAPEPVGQLNFIQDIRPLLSGRCYLCHGPDDGSRRANLRLDTERGLFETRATGQIVVPGHPEASLLFQRITSATMARRMPPTATGKSLSSREIDRIRRWIEEGAEWESHWAFDPPVRSTPPSVGDGWARNEIDHFVFARMQANGLQPSAEATPAALLRRVTFDLTGLPPTLEELDAFVANPTEAAYASAVERLLASPHYGEHMAVGWLDTARYADSHGDPVDEERTAWPWRDTNGVTTSPLSPPRRRRANRVALARLGDRRVQPEHVVRSIHDLAARGRLDARVHTHR